MLLLALPLVFVCTCLMCYLGWRLWAWLGLLARLDRLSERLWQRLPEKFTARLRMVFDSNDQYHHLHRLVHSWLCLLILAALIAVLWGQAVGLIAAILLLLLQVSRNQNRFKAKQQAIVKELPDFSDLLAMMIAAGIPLIPAMARVADACAGGRLAQEMSRANQQLRQGTPFSEALEQVASRYRLALLNEWTGLLIQGHRQGSSLVTTLRFHSIQMRQQLLNEAEKRAQEAPVKLLFPLMTCFFPVNFLVILGPIILQIGEGGL